MTRLLTLRPLAGFPQSPASEEAKAEARAIGTPLALILVGEDEEAHGLVQEDASPMGSYLHGVIHRHEGDYRNARYWFARSGDPGLDPLGITAKMERGENADDERRNEWMKLAEATVA